MDKLVQVIYFDAGFQATYLGVDCYADFMDEVPSASQIKKDARAL